MSLVTSRVIKGPNRGVDVFLDGQGECVYICCWRFDSPFFGFQHAICGRGEHENQDA